ncbi:MAG TPA: TOBE domain-containing protein, partial [Thalassobaculum sp.]
EFIRAERPGGADAVAGNVLTGTVDSLLFNGANSRVLVRSDRAALIEAGVTLTGGPDDLRPGEAVRLMWSPEQARCFVAEAASR